MYTKKFRKTLPARVGGEIYWLENGFVVRGDSAKYCEQSRQNLGGLDFNLERGTKRISREDAGRLIQTMTFVDHFCAPTPRDVYRREDEYMSEGMKLLLKRYPFALLVDDLIPMRKIKIQHDPHCAAQIDNEIPRTCICRCWETELDYAEILEVLRHHGIR